MILNVLEYYETQPGRVMTMIFLDAKNTFDNINCNFMLKQLEIMEAGKDFVEGIRTIYRQQKVKIRINGELRI